MRMLAAHGLAAAAMAAPWPVLLLAVWRETGGGAWIGIVGACRLAPYILLSWLAGRLADSVHRGRLVELSTAARAVLLGLSAVALARGSLVLAIVLAALAVAAGTPAFPAIAAALPQTEGPGASRATAALVTLEVGAFVIGPAVAGALLGIVPGWVVIAAASLATAAACPLLRAWSRQPAIRPVAPPAAAAVASAGIRLMLSIPVAATAILVVALVNLVQNVVAVSLLPLTAHAGVGRAGSFGLATAVLGLGALGAPLLFRLLGRELSATSLLALATPLLVVALSQGPWTSLPALALVGAACVQIETVTTTIIQDAVPPAQVAGILGLTDSVMVAAGVIGAISTPFLCAAAGPRGAVALSGLVIVTLAGARARRHLAARTAAEPA